MRIDMPYNNNTIEIDINKKNIIDIVKQDKVTGLKNPVNEIITSLKSPIAANSLKKMVLTESPKNVVIVVNDITRPTPYKIILPPLLEVLENSGIKQKEITLLIATGIHRPNTREENIKSFGRNVVNNYRIVNHDPDNNLKEIGVLSDGKSLKINKLAAESDFLITTGQINLHYFAGYSGGRKSILPGIASRSLITSNHARMNEPGCHSGSVTKNPIHSIMLEAALMANVRFSLNVITNDNKEILSVFSGDIKKAWEEGVGFCKKISTHVIDRKADVVIASSGGFPKDINLYQAQKALEHASIATKAGGFIVLFAACLEGYGEPKFKEWMDHSQNWQDIFDMFDQKFELGGHKAFALARALHDKTVLIITELTKEITCNCYFQKVDGFNEALEIINKKLTDWNCYVMPQASSVLPVIGG